MLNQGQENDPLLDHKREIMFYIGDVSPRCHIYEECVAKRSIFSIKESKILKNQALAYYYYDLNQITDHMLLLFTYILCKLIFCVLRCYLVVIDADRRVSLNVH